MKLGTNLNHIESKAQLEELIANNEKVVVVCGRMGPMCIPVYGIMEELENIHEDIKFYDFLFDHPEADVIRNLPEAQNFRGLPFTIYYRNGKVVEATSSIQTPKQVKDIINEVFE
ncbi:MAG: thioredoxin family protein [Candidatus Heimdallarchaeota archaeon]|nr:thioredoxin family protein [Candidatus Heimdallarchaeota archaeon]